MTDLVALGVQTPQINTVGNAIAARGAAIDQNSTIMQQHMASIEAGGQLAFGLLDGNPDGKVSDPARVQQAVTMLGGPDSPAAKALLADPTSWAQQMAKTSISFMKMSADEQQQLLGKMQIAAADPNSPANTTARALQQSEINKNAAEAGMMAGGGKIIPGQPIYGSDGSISYPTEYGSTRQVQLGQSGAVVSPSGGAAAPVGSTTVGSPSVPIAAAPAAAIAAPPHVLTPAEIEAQKTAATESAKIKAALPQMMVAAKSSLTQLDQSDQLVLGKIDDAIKQVDDLSSGWVGKVSEGVPGTPSYNLSKTLDTVRANVGFDKLAAMRAASPSGGALGQVSNFEEQLLQSVLGSLDQGQSKEQLLANLNSLKTFIASNHQQRQDAFNADFAGVAPLSGDTTFNAGAAKTAPAATGLPQGAMNVKTIDGKTLYQLPNDPNVYQAD